MKILGPLIPVVGLIQYKYKIFNLIFKYKTVFSQEVARIGHPYLKTFTVIGNELIKANAIFEVFLNKILL